MPVQNLRKEVETALLDLLKDPFARYVDDKPFTNLFGLFKTHSNEIKSILLENKYIDKNGALTKDGREYAKMVKSEQSTSM